MDFESMCSGFESRDSHFFLCFFFCFCFFVFLSLLLQCKLANSTLLSLLSFSYFITPYDAQASSAFSALIIITNYQSLKSNLCSFHMKTFLSLRVCLINTVLVCLITSPVSDTNVISK